MTKPISAAAKAAQNAARRPNGKFGTQPIAESDVDVFGNDLADPFELNGREEAARAWSLQTDLMRLSDDVASVDLPGGYRAEVVADPDDPGTTEGTGWVEKGQFNVRQYDADGEETGAFMVMAFDDLETRSKAALEVARRAVVADRDTQGPPTKAYIASLRAKIEQIDAADPWNDGIDEDLLAEARAEAAAEARYEVEAAAGTEPGTSSRVIDDPDSFWHGATVISAYTRDDALADGVLVDHSAMAREAGITWPVALTAAAQADAVEWSDDNAGLQDESGRAWDVVYMAARAIKAHAAKNPNGAVGTRIPFLIDRVPNTPRATVARTTRLHVVLSAGDQGEPCWTVCLPDED